MPLSFPYNLNCSLRNSLNNNYEFLTFFLRQFVSSLEGAYSESKLFPSYLSQLPRELFEEVRINPTLITSYELFSQVAACTILNHQRLV
jgi:hypothetical protein